MRLRDTSLRGSTTTAANSHQASRSPAPGENRPGSLCAVVLDPEQQVELTAATVGCSPAAQDSSAPPMLPAVSIVTLTVTSSRVGDGRAAAPWQPFTENLRQQRFRLLRSGDSVSHRQEGHAPCQVPLEERLVRRAYGVGGATSAGGEAVRRRPLPRPTNFEDESLTIEEAAMAASCLSALGGPSHEEAYGMLAAMAERATRNGRAGRRQPR